MCVLTGKVVQAEGEAKIDALTTICNRIWQTGEWSTTWPKERQPTAVSELPHHQPNKPPKLSNVKDHTEQPEAISGEDCC